MMAAICAPAPVEAAYHTSTPADKALEPISDRHPDFEMAEHGMEECPSCWWVPHQSSCVFSQLAYVSRVYEWYNLLAYYDHMVLALFQ